MMSIYRASYAAPDWAETDPNHPSFIKNKPEFIAGDNISISKQGNSIIISAEGVVIPDKPDNPDKPDDPIVPDVPSEEGAVVEYIVQNKIPVYIGFDVSGESVKEYQTLNGETANYDEEGFYVIVKNDSIEQAGYQATFPGSSDSAQSILIPKMATIINTYQYIPSLNQWVHKEFDETYWVNSGETTKEVNGQEYTYVKYVYNSELWGDPIMTTEYWRFEVEV